MAKIRPFCMPKWGIEMTEGTLAEWMVKEGESFSKGQTLCLIETDKITNEVEAEYDSTVRKVLVGAGDEAQPVGALLAVFAGEDASDADIDAFVEGFVPAESGGTVSEDKKPKAAPKADAPAEAKAPVKIETNRPISPEALKLAEAEGVDIANIEGSGRGGRITYQDVHQALRPAAQPTLSGTAELPAEDYKLYASPLARRIAAMYGVDLSGIDGSGARGRISKADVLAKVPDGAEPSVYTTGKAAPAATAAAVSAAVATPEFTPGDNTPTVVPFDGVRKVVAKRLTEAKQQIPHFYLRVSASADKLLEMRKTANLVLGCKASVNDWIVMAAAKALVRHPEVNAQVHGEEVHQFPHADISVAVAGPKGLMTPIVRQADLMRIDQIAAETKRLIEKTNAGKLTMSEMSGGTFSVSNLGMFGIENFDAIINPPQATILAVGGATRQPVETPDGDIAFETRISFTLSVDHRAVDGAAGAQFMATLKSLIEEPEGMFA
ncbi:MAG: 2-oxo acid dehydrogenase subunit E2 [Sphingomonadaceae bacterium]